MSNLKKSLILVGHGGLPDDIPSDIVEKFMRIHKGRVKSGSPITDQELELDSTIRKWERTEKSDPYKFGLESLASHMKIFLDEYVIKTAYNEFCYPTIEEAVNQLVEEGVSDITLVTTMITRGGSHSELEIPEEIKELRSKHKSINIHYAWPFDIDAFALFLSTHVKNFTPKLSASTN
jgi:sirohydrochlorin cobaltochelatase